MFAWVLAGFLSVAPQALTHFPLGGPMELDKAIHYKVFGKTGKPPHYSTDWRDTLKLLDKLESMGITLFLRHDPQIVCLESLRALDGKDLGGVC